MFTASHITLPVHPDRFETPPLYDHYTWFTLAHDLWTHDFTSYDGTVQVGLLADHEALYVSYRVNEPQTMYPPRTEALHNGDDVYEDSCVEFFFQPKGAKNYLNIEMNARGVFLAGFGADRHVRDSVEAVMADFIEIHTYSAPKDPFKGAMWTPTHWALTLRIPLAVIRHFFPDHGWSEWTDRSLRFNAYKCGDETAQPHYRSLFEVHSETPNYHRPEDFGELQFTAHIES